MEEVNSRILAFLLFAKLKRQAPPRLAQRLAQALEAQRASPAEAGGGAGVLLDADPALGVAELRGSELLRWSPDGSVAPLAPRPYGAADGAANGAAAEPATVVGDRRARGPGAARWLLGGAAVCGALLMLARWHGTGGSAALRSGRSYEFTSLREL